MRVRHVVAAVTLSIVVPVLASAQQPGGGTTTGTTGGTGTTTGGTGTGTGGTGTGTGGTGTGTGGTGTGGTGIRTGTGTTDNPTAGQPDPTTDTTGINQGGATIATGVSRWIASGYVGSSFGASAQDAAADFGGSVGYLWNNWLGGEFMAGFTPNFSVQNLALFANERPQVNSYMANAMAAVPLGIEGQWQPFVSGGFGAVTMRSGVGDSNALDSVGNVFAPDDTRAGGNIGAGLMAFVGGWGVRTDVRYFRAFSGSTADNGTAAASVLPGLDFWRANIGVAARW